MPEPHDAQKLTLDLSGVEIPAEKFATGVRAFLDLVKEVAKTVSGRPGNVRWVVRVRTGSALVDFEPRPRRVPAADLSLIVDTVESGIIAAETGSGQPPGCSDRALDHIGKLASILEGRERDLDRVRVWRGGAAHDVTLRSVANIDALSGVEYRDWGTLEGTLITISGRRGLEFAIQDALTERSAKCFFDEELLDEVMGAFRRRVAVSGLIRYRRNGEPVSIVAEDFMIFPPDDQLATFEAVRGILGGAAQ